VRAGKTLTAAQFADDGLHAGDGAAHPLQLDVLKPFLDEGGAHFVVAEEAAVVAHG